MRDDQRVRGLATVALVVGYVARVFAIGDPTIQVPGFGTTSPFVILAVAIVTLALPETLEYIPFGPSRGDT